MRETAVNVRLELVTRGPVWVHGWLHAGTGRCAVALPPDGWDALERQLGCRHYERSTACWHAEQADVTAERAGELHGYCRGEVGRVGAKVPGQCKWCDARCQCACHATEGDSNS